MNYKNVLKVGVLSTALIVASCTKDEVEIPSINQTDVTGNYASIVLANYQDAHADAMKLKTAITAFVSNPTESSMMGAKQAWLESRESYGQSEAFRFWAGPIDDDKGPEGALNAWPLDEGYIDYVYNPQTHKLENKGLIADTNFVLDMNAIADKNEAVDEKSISIGYHAIEFLLWGQDHNLGGNFSSAGVRPLADYTTDKLADRRKQYLTLITDQLIKDLKYVVDAWVANGWGRKAFLAQSNKDALTDIFNGIGKLAKGELAGERMFVALSNNDQEDEHSCFSDNTHRDIVTNFEGIANVWNGTYKNIKGKSIADLVAEKDANLRKKVDNHLANTRTLVNAIDANKPFDKLISASNPSGNKIVTDAVISLQELGDLFVESASKIGISFTAELEE